LKAPSAPEIGLLLAGSLCLLPFLLPYHQQPVLSFYPEWLAVALGIAASLTLLLTGAFRTDAALPAPALWFTAFAVFLALHAWLGEQTYPQSALLATLYVLYSVLMVQLGSQLVATVGIERVAIVLATCVLAGALANAVAGIVQFYGRPALFEDIVAELRGRRAYGNIAQPNLYTNYLALGQAALLYLWLRARMRTPYAVAALVLLVVASALSGARGAVVYATWFALLGALAGRVLDRPDATRLTWGALGVAGAVVLAQTLVPWANTALQLGLAGESGFERLRDLAQGGFEPRLPVFLLALRIFAADPIGGAGIGEFPGAVFARGLDPELTAIGEVWTSPHNLPLHLLAETGLLGALLVFGGLFAWAAQLVRRYRRDSSVALWWIVAAAGVELLHSLIEYPLWSAHFLGVAALLVGASTLPKIRPAAAARAARISGLAAAVVLAVALALTLRDYVRLDLARAAGTRATLASVTQARRDADTMQTLRNGLLGPVAELWIFTGAPLDRSRLDEKLAMSERLMRRWPANAIVVRRAVFLALAGESDAARTLLQSALRAFPHRHAATVLLLKQALATDREGIAPLLAVARQADANANNRTQAEREVQSD